MRRGNIETKTSGKKAKKITKNNIAWMCIWLILAIFMIVQVVNLALYTLGKKERQEVWLYNVIASISTSFEKPGTKEEFVVKFAGLGDIYFTNNTIKAAKTSTGYDFVKGTENISSLLKGYDLVIASLNTPIADKYLGYSTKKSYNAPIEILTLLKELNVTAVTTATKNVLDKNEKGIKETIENLEKENIKQVGINHESRKDPLVISKNNINIGILSYTTFSNVKMSEKNSYLVNIFDEEDLKKDVEYLKSQNVDFIISYLTTNNEDVLMVDSEQKKITEKLFDAGVNIVLGTGSMVVQEALDETTENGKRLYSIYSLGDFMGSYATDDNLFNVIVNIEFKKEVKKDSDGNEIKSTTSFEIKKPIGVWSAVNKNYSKQLYLLEDEISNYDLGKSEITKKEYNKMKEAKTRYDSLFTN